MGWADPLYLYLDDYWRHDLSVSFTPDRRNPKLNILFFLFKLLPQKVSRT